MFNVIEGGRFLDLCIAGRVLLDDIDDYIDQWHDSDDDNELSQYLGMTAEEYEIWVHSPETLHLIIASRLNKVPLMNVLESSFDLPIAARASSAEAAKFLMKWLSAEEQQ
jgi:hypothetical protein